jgi:hypothetical protein
VLALAQVETAALVEPLPRPQEARRTGLPLELMAPLALPPLSARTFLCQVAAAALLEAQAMLAQLLEAAAQLQELQQQVCLKSISTSAAQAQTEGLLELRQEHTQRALAGNLARQPREI